MTKQWYSGEEAAAIGVCAAQYGDGQGRSWMLLVSQHDPAPGPGTDEVQHLEILGGPNGGSFRLEFGGQWTAGIAYHPSAAQLQNGLSALATIGPGNVVCTKPSNWGYDITYQNALGHQNVQQLGWDDSTLNGGTVLVTTVTPGSTGKARKTAKPSRKR